MGVIVKQDENTNPIVESLTHKEVEIKKMYFNWWKQNKDKPMEILREEFRNEDTVLQLPYVCLIIEYKYDYNRLSEIIYPNHPENNVCYTYGNSETII
jgi:hypothetical protein